MTCKKIGLMRQDELLSLRLQFKPGTLGRGEIILGGGLHSELVGNKNR